ncbi:hypothetical protein EXU85_35150 [Spirosoma sp. KCTC 42546]|uniref:DUF7010 family protein n=1 Tax=Spirosoma sp. KCTC 42546 TaxID=2520506 RepID=UPI001158F986|nr:hypothetical protein [Spirosoma sp. KCTC 42546]QDK83561.1 hypothetical protein EXU85_35150 [Spirosoma sp. KCTC 42546]
MNFHKELIDHKQQFFLVANAGLSLPVAGAIYWFTLGIAGFCLKPAQWVLTAFFTSGLLFPLGLVLQKPFKSNLIVKTPLASLIPFALFAMMLSWGITIPASGVNKSLVPLCLAIGMSLHWPIIGWLYNSTICQLHALIRALGVVTCWYLFPDDRFTILPLLVSAIYVLTVLGLTWEVTKVRKQTDNQPAITLGSA